MQPKIYNVTDHDIDLTLVDSDAQSVIRKLRDAGFMAYLVGGSVRDLLLKRVPKDFDISTSATPEEIKQLFQRQCLLIGRRFRLAHVRFGKKIFEVATFRSGEEEQDLILRDNQWGNPEEDARRRDFTINGLFYDPIENTVIDYVGGWDDIHAHTLRTIGAPEVRFKQDPVRMIRLLKFRARFGFHITPEAKKAIVKCKNEILKSSPARLLEEILRMLESGASAPFFNLLCESGMLQLLHPAYATFLQSSEAKRGYLYLASADQVNQGSKIPLDRSILMSCLLFPMLEKGLQSQKDLHFGEVLLHISQMMHDFLGNSFMHFPKRLTAIMSSILSMQYRLTPLSGKLHHHPKILRQKDFSPALAFLKLRALVDKELIDTYTSWKAHHRQYHHQTKEHHNPPPEPEPPPPVRKTRRRRRPAVDE